MCVIKSSYHLITVHCRLSHNIKTPTTPETEGFDRSTRPRQLLYMWHLFSPKNGGFRLSHNKTQRLQTAPKLLTAPHPYNSETKAVPMECCHTERACGAHYEQQTRVNNYIVRRFHERGSFRPTGFTLTLPLTLTQRYVAIISEEPFSWRKHSAGGKKKHSSSTFVAITEFLSPE